MKYKTEIYIGSFLLVAFTTICFVLAVLYSNNTITTIDIIKIVTTSAIGSIVIEYIANK